jgi:amphi-Trp domain-containing protein
MGVVFKHESMQDLDSIIAFLNSVRDGFANRRLMVADKKKEVVFTPSGLIKFDVEAKCKDGRCKLALKFSWNEGEQPPAGEDLLIGAG